MHPAFHALHHARLRGHYGFFTPALDRLFGHVFHDYEELQGRATRGDGATRRLSGAPAAAVVLAGVAVALPAATTARAEIASSCRGDYMRFCLGVTPGEGRVARCLAGKRDQLSPACARNLSAAANCRPEIERFCRSSGSPSALKSCLEARRAELGADCRESLSLF